MFVEVNGSLLSQRMKSEHKQQSAGHLGDTCIWTGVNSDVFRPSTVIRTSKMILKPSEVEELTTKQ